MKKQFHFCITALLMVSSVVGSSAAAQTVATVEKLWSGEPLGWSTADSRQWTGYGEYVYWMDKAKHAIVGTKDGVKVDTVLVNNKLEGVGFCVDDAGNWIAEGNFLTYEPIRLMLVKRSDKTIVEIEITGLGRTDMITATGDVFSANGGVVFLYGNNVNLLTVSIKNAGQNSQEVKIKEIAVKGGGVQNYVVAGDMTNQYAQRRSAGQTGFDYYENGVNIGSIEGLTGYKHTTLSGAMVTLAGKTFAIYPAGTQNYSSEFSVTNLTDGVLAVDKTDATKTVFYANTTTRSNSTDVGVYVHATKIDNNNAYIQVGNGSDGTALFKLNYTNGVGKDDYAYPPQGEISEYKLTNKWIYSNVLENFEGNQPAPNDNSRGMVVKDGKMYFINRATEGFTVVDGATGKMLDPIKISGDHLFQTQENGEWKDCATLKYNDVKLDQAGHILIAGCVMGSNRFQVYNVNINTGAATVVVDDRLSDYPEFGNPTWRFDAFNVYGNVNNHAIIMAADANSFYVYKWEIKNGKAGKATRINCTPKSTDVSCIVRDGVLTVSSFGQAPQIIPVDFEYFYVDGFNILPMLFNMEGELLMDFATVPSGGRVVMGEEVCNMNTGHNGLCEFQVGNEYFLLMAATNTAGSPASAFALYKFADENRKFSEMTPLWFFPKDGMGSAINSCRAAVPSVEVNGNEATIYIYTTNNGYAAYTFSSEGKTIKLQCDKSRGTVSGGGKYIINTEQTITASPNYGYHFVSWNDGNTDNPRTITVTKDETFTATFAKNIYSITKVANSAQGSINGPSQAEYLDQVSLTAVPEYGYHFTQWSDGNTDNPRTIELTQDTTFTTEFAIDKSGTCGDNNMLVWEYDSATKTLAISGKGTLNSNYTYGIEAPIEAQNLIVGNEVTSIGASAFSSYSSLTSVTIPNSVTSIGNSAFYGCSGLTSVTIPNSVTSIGGGAFSGCSALNGVTLFPDAIVNKTYSASSNITSIFGKQVTEYVLGDDVSAIGDYAFYDCTDLRNVAIGNSVTYIGDYSFYGGVNLTSVTLPDSLFMIGNEAFGNCGLTSIIIPDNTIVSYEAFKGCNNLTQVTLNTREVAIGDYCTWNTSLKDCFGNQVIEYIIGNKVNGIAPCAFRNCSNMTSITIPNSVKSIGENAFYGCSKLTNISIPNNLTSIESKTFYNCSALTSIAIPNAVASIGNSAFENCTNLETLSLSESISKYGENAFAGCPNISSIYNYRERPAKLGTETFKDVDYFECTLYVLAGSVDMYKSSGSDWKDFYFIEPIGAAAVTTEDVQVTPTETTAAVMWPTVENAATYELVIRDKSGNVVCTLIFNSNGQLTSIVFAAPGRILSSVQSAGFSFTVTGLDSGTRYNLTLNAKDDKGMVLQSTTQSFTTTGGVATGLEPVEPSTMHDGAQKVLLNGQLFILREGKMYNVQGLEVR